MSAWRKNRNYYLLLALIVAPVIAYEIRYTWDRVMVNYSFNVPFTFRVASRRLVNVEPAGLEAGLREGDRVLAINGQAFRGFGVLQRAARLAQPDERLVLEIERAGQRLTVILPWGQLKRTVTYSDIDFALTIALEILIPWF